MRRLERGCWGEGFESQLPYIILQVGFSLSWPGNLPYVIAVEPSQTMDRLAHSVAQARGRVC